MAPLKSSSDDPSGTRSDTYRVLTNHPAERQDTWVLDNYFQANLWSFPPRPSRGPVFGHLKHREPSQVYTKLVPIRIIFRFRDIGRSQPARDVTNNDFWSPLHNSPFGAITREVSFKWFRNLDTFDQVRRVTAGLVCYYRAKGGGFLFCTSQDKISSASAYMYTFSKKNSFQKNFPNT